VRKGNPGSGAPSPDRVALGTKADSVSRHLADVMTKFVPQNSMNKRGMAKEDGQTWPPGSNRAAFAFGSRTPRSS